MVHEVVRKVWVGSNHSTTEVESLDETSIGNAHYGYRVVSTGEDPQAVYATLHFQRGSAKAVGRNGCYDEDLLAIVIDRLQCFQQSGTFVCRENALALTKLEEAMHWLNYRKSRKRTYPVTEGGGGV